MTLSSDISTTSTALSDIKSAIIAKGVTPSGNITTYATAISNIPTGGSSSKYGATIDCILGNLNANNVLQMPTEKFDLSFPTVVDIADYALFNKFARTKAKSVSFPLLSTVSGQYSLYNTFSNCTSLTSVSFPELTTISGYYGFNYTFSNCTSLTSVSFPKLTTMSGSSGFSSAFSYCTSLASVSFPELTTISGYSGFSNVFSNCTSLTSVSFPKLTTMYSSSLSQGFYNCKNISSISFPALTTTSFGNNVNQFSNMLSGTGTTVTHTLHFPSNLSSKISGLTGYPNFGGTSGYVTLSFDLPATS